MNTWPTRDWHLNFCANSSLKEPAKKYEEELKRNLLQVPFTHHVALKLPFSMKFVEIGQAAFILFGNGFSFAFYYIGEMLIDNTSYDFLPEGALLIPKASVVKKIIHEQMYLKDHVIVFDHHQVPTGDIYPSGGRGVFMWDDGQRITIRTAKDLPDEEDIPVLKALANLRTVGLYPDFCADQDQECDHSIWLSACSGMFIDRSFSEKPEPVAQEVN